MWRLAVVWFLGAGIVFVILIGQSLFNYYEPKTDQAWGWFLPTVMPTLSLIIAALVAEGHMARTRTRQGQVVDRSLYILAQALSVFYLALVLLSLLIQPFLRESLPLELMQRSNLWLGPVQALVVAVLGFFYRTAGAKAK